MRIQTALVSFVLYAAEKRRYLQSKPMCHCYIHTRLLVMVLADAHSAFAAEGKAQVEEQTSFLLLNKLYVKFYNGCYERRFAFSLYFFGCASQ